MLREVAFSCAEHPDRFTCPDAMVEYSARLREYGLIVRDGGNSVRVISFCPWCGAPLPHSLRDRWFEELEQLGIDPHSDEIPAAYLSEQRWARAELS